MDAEELLERIGQGTREFRKEKIINQSFRNQTHDLRNITFINCDLSGTDFSGNDLRGLKLIQTKINGTKFIESDLTGANLTGIKTGLSLNWKLWVFSASLFILSLSGFSSAIFLTFICYYFRRKNLPSWLVCIIATIFITAFRTLLLDSQQSWLLNANIYVSIAAIIGVGCFGIAASTANKAERKMALTSLFILLLIITLILVSAEMFPWFGDFEKKYIVEKFNNIGIDIGIRTKEEGKEIIKYGSWLKGVISGLVGAILGSIYSLGAIKRDERFEWMWRFFLQILIDGCGTNFSKSKLGNASLANSNLKGSCFLGGKFQNTKFHGAKFLECADFRGTSLQKNSIQLLATKRDGYDKHFEGEDLRGINLENASLEKAHLTGANLSGCNLQGANLSHSNLTGANLSGCNLQSADLSHSNLKQVQLRGANLSRAKLTSAYIENWVIDRNTQFDDIECKYIVISEQENFRDKSEYQQIFSQASEFIDYVHSQIETSKLLFPPDRNNSALAQSLCQIAEDYSAYNKKIPFIIIEPRKNDSLLIHIPTPENISSERLYRDVIQLYKEFQKSPSVLRNRYKCESEIEQALNLKITTTVNIQINIQTGAKSEMNPTNQNSSSSASVNGNGSQAISVNGSGISFDNSHSVNNTSHQTINNNDSQGVESLRKELMTIFNSILQRTNTPDIANAEPIKAKIVQELEHHPELVAQELEHHPELRDRLKNALMRGGIDALGNLLPFGSSVIEAIQGYLETP